MPNSDLIPAPKQSLAIERDEMSVQRQPTPMEMIAAIARDPSIPVERITALIGLQERMEAREAEKEFNRDFAAAMLDMPRVAKKGAKVMGDKGTIMFARYEDIDAVVRPIESRHGFARSFSTRTDGKPGSVMTLRLTHRAGHAITSERYCRPDPGPGRNDTQAEGSGESYGRRYLTLAVWNIVTVGADDDANSADPITDEQAMGIRDMLEHLAMTPTQSDKFWAWAEVPTHKPEDIQTRQYAKVRKWLADQCKGGKR